MQSLRMRLIKKKEMQYILTYFDTTHEKYIQISVSNNCLQKEYNCQS